MLKFSDLKVGDYFTINKITDIRNLGGVNIYMKIEDTHCKSALPNLPIFKAICIHGNYKGDFFNFIDSKKYDADIEQLSLSLNIDALWITK